MSKLVAPLFFTADLGFCRPDAEQPHLSKMTWPPMSEAGYIMAKQNADAQYEIDNGACASRSGIALDICVAQARGKNSVTRADAEAAYENTPRSHENARAAHARADANVHALVTADAPQDAATRQIRACGEANADKRDAEYKAQIENCRALADSRGGNTANAEIDGGSRKIVQAENGRTRAPIDNQRNDYAA